MNKYYPTKKINSAWLVETDSYRSMGGIKNIIGIIVEHNNERLFYSILDDCFFRVLPSREEGLNNSRKYYNRVFVEIYADGNLHMSHVGVELYEKLKADFLTKEEIIANKKLIRGYFSDFDYEINIDTKVDFENASTIDENIIDSVSDYKEKLGRPITYYEGHIYGPVKKKTL